MQYSSYINTTQPQQRSHTYHTILDLLLGFLSHFPLLQNQFFVALQDMCPLRFILVFFSAAMAAYFAWTTVRSSPETDFTGHDHKNKDHFNLKKMIQNGFWVFVDMASGRYLWRNLRSKNHDVEVKSSQDLGLPKPQS